MKLLISILAILTFLPIICILGSTLLTTDMPDICKNESLTLTIKVDRIELKKGSIASSLLRCIRISGPIIEIAEGSFDNVPNLMYLDLAQNRIHPSNLFSFGDLPKVRILSLGNQYSINYEDQTVVRYVYPSLEYLDLSSSHIYYIDDFAVSFPNLTHLDLSGNNLSPYSFEHLPNTLMYLDLSGNQRVSWLRLRDTPNLLSLRIDNNDLREISDVTVTKLEKLVDLSMANNFISQINEEDFQNMMNIRSLNLADNRLSSTNLNVTAYLPSLETLILDSNSFENVTFTAFPNLTTLSINYNRIRNLTASSFFNLPYLKRLHLSGNIVESVHVDTFQNQKLLEELHLDGNLLSYLPVLWCQYMENLRYLNLARNKFTSLGSAIYSCTVPMLELHLEGNPIAYINSSAAQLIPENMNVYLNGDFQSSETLCKFKAIQVSTRSPYTSGYNFGSTPTYSGWNKSWMSSRYSWET